MDLVVSLAQNLFLYIMSKQPTRQQYNKAFQRMLVQLNPQQRAAVEQMDGPVLVVAGPGTGKTHILSARIGQILQETDAFAHNILCLTFTDAGVLAMRERLLKFIGPEAHRVHIYTFHSFCNSIIQENLEVFGRHDLEPLSELERVEVIRRIIDDLPFDHILKKGRSNVYFYENHLFDIFKKMKSEDWSVASMHEQIDAYLLSLPTRPDFIYQRRSGPNPKGAVKQAQLDLAHEKMERLKAAASLFPTYEHYLHQLRRYDFDDMILWVLRAFENNPLLLRNYQERYLYFLVDEYQDTNGAQNGILHQLLRYWENPNIFIVGDDDQSIYEFQGARLRNIVDFYYDFEQYLKVVVLKNNYRSSQTILDTSNALIRCNEKRLTNSIQELGVDKRLLAQHPDYAASKGVPEIHIYPNRFQEEAAIVAQIEALQKANFPLQEVAIIYAQHRQVRNIVQLLEKKGIPYHSKRRINILNEPLIQNLRKLLDYIDLEYRHPTSGEHLIFQILHIGFLGFVSKDLTQLSLFLAKNRLKKRWTWRQVLSDSTILAQIPLEHPQAFLDFAALIDEICGDYANFSLPMLLERIINKSGLIRHSLQHSQKTWLLQLIKTFFDFAKKETDRRPRIQLHQFLEVLQQMDTNRLSIPINRTNHAPEGVQLVTAHSSKGLEFQKVFIIDAVKDYWEPRHSNRKRFPLPDTLTFSGEEDALEARRRLFYVAMTRAKEALYISYSQKTIEEKPLQQTIFVDEIIEKAPWIKVKQVTLAPEILLETEIVQLTSNQVPQISLPDKALITKLLEGFVLSVSALNRYLKCPLSFYYEYILKVPTLMSPAAAYGTAMHYALMKLFDKAMASPTKTFPSAKVFIQFFEKEMERQAVHFSQKEYQHRFKKGRAVLAAYYQQQIDAWQKNSRAYTGIRTELEVRQVEMNGIPIKGVIDRIDLLNESAAHIEDYKTGNKDSKKLRKSSSKNPLGGGYWRQLLFYKVLYESALPSLHTIRTGAIAYLEPDSKDVFTTKTVNLGGEDAAFMRQLIQSTWKKIQAHEFDTGCNEPNCVWCNFVQHNELPNSFSEPEIEALDD